jgi:hypothetical protein
MTPFDVIEMTLGLLLAHVSGGKPAPITVPSLFVAPAKTCALSPRRIPAGA